MPAQEMVLSFVVVCITKLGFDPRDLNRYLKGTFPYRGQVEICKLNQVIALKQNRSPAAHMAQNIPSASPFSLL